MRKENLPAVQAYFKLSENETKHLIGCNAGEGIAKIGNECIPLKIEISEYELDVIKGRKTGQKALSKAQTGSTFQLVDLALNDLVVKHGIMFESWTKEPSFNPSKMGYISKNVQHVIGQGRYNVWIRKDLLNNDMIGNESANHYAGVLELAGFLIQNGYPVEVNHYDGVDISASINGSKIAFELEISKKDRNVLIQKYENALKDHAEVYFISTSTNIDELTEVLGASNVIPRGAQFEEYITGFIESRKALLRVL